MIEAALGVSNFIIDRLLQIRKMKKEKREKIADFCVHVASRLKTGRDNILDAYMKRIAADRVSIPSEIEMYSAVLVDIAPELFSDEHAYLLKKSGRLIDDLERASVDELMKYERNALHEKFEDVNRAIGQFDAMAQLIRLM